jgi:hypothetical protein
MTSSARADQRRWHFDPYRFRDLAAWPTMCTPENLGPLGDLHGEDLA